ncbi:Rpn family recombination-promoting nuclease/putative transposase [[Clostridium] innocuum]|uniref:Rpn family recombination-promoting nuclease/putative transposase n=1 Tax=Clostridium sp. HGF2 TaxID=908340 RepID=UPI000E4E19D3|nr:Rpn family recombination-promoting nuclease/putative transposase [[Clostridium] innocuum]MCR0242727.1 Rpn family recombination-promoting nuclease/putative transposase [[Clostridium] innocuum]MCR0426508.1 Rpn family recombination-promoting nuclease/putative transposase [[Clostridium] innocuum]MCR0463648.1 Rpn family recombination-promoting nuclease/putative transposase [[Clostridium] innocuum]MCR0612859.1 Rpn family recombination-promoting nuclease/putative transposase [[Clostridium] innocuum
MNVRCNKSTQLQLFFKYTLSREDEGSVYARNTIIERVTGIRVKESTVLNPNLDPGIIGKKRIILDVHVKDEQNRHFNIEMQTTYKGLAEMMRFEFYGARALNNQLNSGKKYRDLKPVYQIIFIDEYAWNNRNLINHYQMRNEQGENESYYPLILRTYIHMPAINDIVKEKEMQRLNDFEQLIYLFENNEKNDILKSKERLVKVFMDKYEEMQKDDELWSTAMAIQMGEARYRYGLEDSYEEGMKEGIMKGKEEGKIEGEKVGIHKGRIEGKISLLLQLLDSKYHEDCSVWLFSLNNEQIENVSSLILTCNTLQELKDQVMISQ